MRPRLTQLPLYVRIRSRAFHLRAEAAVRLLHEEIPQVQVERVKDLPPEVTHIRFLASRKNHTPAIQITPPSALPRTIPLDLDDPEAHPLSNEPHKTILQDLWRIWTSKDLTRLEISLLKPNSSDINKHLKLLNPSIEVDDFSNFRQQELKADEDTSHLHPLEIKARRAGLFYHKSKKGNIGCYGYGAGVAMSTMDGLVAAGGEPANFLDGGGGATPENVAAAMDIVLGDPDVKVIFVNSFGGLTKTNLIATGIVKILRQRKEEGLGYPPMYIRLRGTEENEARKTLEEAMDLENIHLYRDMREAAAAAVAAAKKFSTHSILSEGPVSEEPSPCSSSVGRAIQPLRGKYETTMKNLMPPDNARVLIMGTGKASHFHNKVAQDYGTNIVAAVSPGKGGQIFLGKPVYNNIAEGVAATQPYAVAVFVPPRAAADAIIECIDAEIPLIVSFAEGIPAHDQLRVQKRLRSQSVSRLVGANCPGMIIPSQKLKLGIQPLHVHSPGRIGLASRSGTISYELAALTTELGFGQSVVFGLGGDPFPGTRTWEALQVMLDNPRTDLICLVGEIGGQMEEEAAAVYMDYKSKLPSGRKAKPVVGFIAGASTARGLMYGHAGAIWFDEAETARSKAKCWEDAGIVVAKTLGDVGDLIQQEMRRL